MLGPAPSGMCCFYGQGSIEELMNLVSDGVIREMHDDDTLASMPSRKP
ncbi:hypothetical protein [Sulfuriflexus sp.]|nr:hypothetical protein [Sulfuriflexus sp.]MDT8404904.1 hypothetical protein [Sulfuriflexus sp.]